jgi:hypothetical protein
MVKVLVGADCKILKTVIIRAKWKSLDMNAKYERICMYDIGSMSKGEMCDYGLTS